MSAISLSKYQKASCGSPLYCLKGAAFARLFWSGCQRSASHPFSGFNFFSITGLSTSYVSSNRYSMAFFRNNARYTAVRSAISKCPRPVSQRNEMQLRGYIKRNANAGFTRSSHHSYSPSIIKPGMPSIVRFPHSMLSRPYPVRLVRGASP